MIYKNVKVCVFLIDIFVCNLYEFKRHEGVQGEKIG
jgi:hypothetical protein